MPWPPQLTPAHGSVVGPVGYAGGGDGEGGDGGGEIVAMGTPEKVAGTAGSHTGHYLARLLEKTPKNSKPEDIKKVS